MLSVGKVTAGSAAYYEASVARGEEDYYRRGGEAPGTWIGDGLDQIEGIETGEELSPEAHTELFEQLQIGGTQLGVPTSSRFVTKTEFDVEQGRTVPVLDAEGDPLLIEQHPVTALDLTFSAPKSVSTVWAVGDQDLGDKIWAAHHAAVDAAFGYLEENGCYSRSGKGGTEVVDGNGFIAARYDHRTSRNLDPQIHSHVLVANRVQRNDGQWRAVDARPVYQQAKTVGMVYQAGLRAEIEATTDLRFGVVDANGQAELLNIQPNVLDAFSTRSGEIDAGMDAWRRDWAISHDGEVPPARVERSMRAAMTLGTRTTKGSEEYSTVELREQWRDRIVEHGFDPEAIIQPVTPLPQQDSGRGVEEMRVEGVRGDVSRTAGVFSRDDVARTAARYVTGRDASEVVENLETMTDGVLSECVTAPPITDDGLRESDRRPTVERPGAAIHTTTATLEMEQRVLRWAEQAGANKIEAGVEEFPGLDDSQAAAVVQVLGDGNQVSVIVGPAGHGKTTTVTEIAVAWRAEFGDVVGVAPSAQASQLLSEAGVDADTIDAWLLNPNINAGDLVVVDEAGMVGTHHLDQLRAHTQRVGAKVLLVGDPEQLSAVRKSGGILADLVEAQPLPGHGLSVAELGVAHRFNNDTASGVAAGLRDRDPNVVGVLEDAGWLHGHQTPVDAQTAVIHAAWSDHEAGYDTVMLVSTRADATALNQQWQDRRVDHNELDPATRSSGGLCEGDLIVAKQNRRDLAWTTPEGESEWLRNGTPLTIEAHTPDGGAACRTPDGTRITIDQEYLKAHTQLGYARTIHSAQGATVDKAHVLLGRSTEADGLYVAGSRARQETHFHITQPASIMSDHSPTNAGAGGKWSPGDVVGSAMERVDPNSRSAHRMLREHHAEQTQALTNKFHGVTPPAYPKPAERDRLENLITKASRHDTPVSRMQIQTLTEKLAEWGQQHDTATAFDQQPGAVTYRTQFDQQAAQRQVAPEVEQKHAQELGY